MPMTAISSVIFTFTSLPSRVLMLSVLPSMPSMVPRMRTVGGCWAHALTANTDITASEAASARGIHEAIFGMTSSLLMFMVELDRRTKRIPRKTVLIPLHRRRQAIAADADAVGFK